MSYATVQDVENRMSRELSLKEQEICTVLLEDAAVIIDCFNVNADSDVKCTVSCRMVIRALGDGEDSGIPIGASQATMSAMNYSQSWTMSSGSSAGELYLSKLEKQLLGTGNKIGSYSPVQELCGSQND